MRIVVDTNVIASAIFFGGKPYQFLHYIMEGRVDVVASKEIVDEYVEDCKTITKTGRPKSRQAWMELALKDNLSVNLEEDGRISGSLWRRGIVGSAL